MYRVEKAVGLENIPEVRALREEIFVEEQGFKDEFDDIDPIALHIAVFDGEAPIGTGRTFKDQSGEYYIGRIAVKKECRRKKVGQFIMAELERLIREQGGTKASLWAQTRMVKFYESVGYKSTGETHMEEFCHHTKMEKIL